MLSHNGFLEAVGALNRGGSVVVFFLATFKPISDAFGIPGAQLAGQHLDGLASRTGPADAIVGSLSWLSTGVFLPGVGRTEADAYVAAVRQRLESEDLEVSPGEWVEVRVAAGVAEHAPGANAADALQLSAARAEADEVRFPEDWRYPVLFADD